jgi:hypothetical protein
MLGKIKNWLLPVLLALAGSAEMFIGIFSEIVKEAELPSYYVHVFRMVALFITVVLVKKQPRSLKRAAELRTRHLRKSNVQNEKPT